MRFDILYTHGWAESQLMALFVPEANYPSDSDNKDTSCHCRFKSAFEYW